MAFNPETYFSRNKGLIKVIGVTVLALFINFTIEVVFSLVYRNYTIFSSNFNFFYTLFTLFVIIGIISGFNKKLDQWISWEADAMNRFIIQGVTNVLISVLVFFIFKLIGIFFLTFTFWSESFGYTTLGDISTNLIIVSVYMLLYVFFELSINLLSRWRLSLASIEAFKKENMEFQFNVLRAQINPHFLFNSLNTLSSLIYADQELASKYTRKLSNVYRNILENRTADVISLSEELEALKNYLELLQIRFQEALKVEVIVSDSAKKTLIPPLTLQMLIENAIKHNIVSIKKPLYITIKESDNYLVVSNNLQHKSTEPTESTAFGLKNIKSRLAFLTDKQVEISDSNNSFTVKIPLVYEA